MPFKFRVDPHTYEAGEVFEDTKHGAYIEIGDNATYEWFQERGYEGNGYTILALVETLCRLDFAEDEAKLEREAEADNTWIYTSDKDIRDRFLKLWNEQTQDEAGVNRLIENASDDVME